MGIIFKRECSENKKNSCGEYLYGYFDLLKIANLQIVCCKFNQCYIDLLKDPLSNV